MKPSKLRPMLSTEDIRGTIDFYVTLLGFECTAFEPEWDWASLQLDNIEIMLSCPGDLVPFEKPIFTGSFYFSIDTVDELWERLKEKAKVAYPIENMEYGMREFAIYDNNGYVLQFGQEINVANNEKNALNNM